MWGGCVRLESLTYLKGGEPGANALRLMGGLWWFCFLAFSTWESNDGGGKSGWKA
ncbi:hypothetical protein Pla52n_46340 [Stieleria varia]|uniref:Uncharacterized protein n=1 Tax=Stieleria varia TaxID=2528005 RepID=A0A5C6ANK4_9BACT|nr:hypothetical protein Pla52n_46340 [Stieleria varia]